MTHDLTNHLNRKFKCNQTQIPNPVHPSNSNISRSQSLASNPLSSVVYVHKKEGSKRGQATYLSIEDLANWLANPEIKNNPTIINKKVPKTDIEWFDLMEESSSKRQKKTKVSQPIEEDFEAEPGSTTQQNGIQYAKDMFKVDGAEYAFSTWFIDTEEHKLEARMTEDEYLIRVKFIRANIVISDKETKRGFKIIDKYKPIRESKKAGGKYIRGGPMLYLQKKTKPGFWVGIDEKFLVREVSGQSKNGTLNCVAERVIEHFDQAKRGHGLTKIRARVQDIAELEKILKRPIILLDITHGTIFNSKKYRSDNDTWEAINNALQGPQAIWLMGVGDETQRISQFVLEDSRTFRTWKKHIEIIEACKQLVFGTNHARSRLANEINKWYPISGKINDDIKRACVEHGHVAVNGKLPKDDITGFAQVRSFKFAPNIHPVIPVWYEKHFACRDGDGYIKEKGWAPIVLLQYLFGASILEDLMVGEVIIFLTKQTKVWLPNNRDISCAIIGKFIQGSKIDKKHLTHRLVTDEGELDFLIKVCTDAGTFAGREKCLLGFILTYYEGHQPQYTHLRASMLAYAHINLLEMLRRFEPNEVVRIATDSIYVRKEALYKIENVPAFFKQEKAKDPDLCPHTYPLCAMCTNPEEFFILKSEYAKWIKEFLKMKMPLVKNDCKSQWRDKGEKIYGPNADIVYWPKNRHWESIKDITESTAPSIHDPITRSQVSYLNREGGSGKTIRAIRIFKDINMVVFTHMNALAKNFQNDHKHMGEKKFPQVVIWDEVCTVPKHILEMFINYLLEQKCQEVLTDYRAKCPKLCELKKGMHHKNNRVQSELFRGAIPVIEKWKYLEKEWSSSDRILSAHRLFRRLASQICLKLHCTKYSEIPIPLIYRPKDGCKQNCLVPIPGSSEKKELVKNDIIHLPLNTLPNKFLQGMLGKEKAIDWELEYAMTIHTSQGMTLKAPQRVWDNLIYFAVGHIEYLGQLIRIKGYMDQDKKKGREFNLSVDYILVLKDLQKNKCELCLNEMLWEWDEAGNPDQWTVDRIDNKLGHIEGNIRLVCLECMAKIPKLASNLETIEIN
ncbi:16365_t:CDS:10, partial [Gigaspora margarita]